MAPPSFSSPSSSPPPPSVLDPDIVDASDPDGAGQMFVRFVARATLPNIVLTRVTHHATVGMVDCYLRALEPQLEHGPVEIFHDWAGVTGYDTDARRRMTAWGSSRGQAITHVHLLLGSKVLAMGVSVASLALGRDFAVHYDRVRWEESLAALLPDYRLRLL